MALGRLLNKAIVRRGRVRGFIRSGVRLHVVRYGRSPFERSIGPGPFRLNVLHLLVKTPLSHLAQEARRPCDEHCRNVESA
jgi:hypothetical protein